MILRPVRSAYGTQFIPHVLQSHTAHSKSIDIVYLLLLTPSKQIQSKIKSKIPSCLKLLFPSPLETSPLKVQIQVLGNLKP